MTERCDAYRRAFRVDILFTFRWGGRCAGDGSSVLFVVGFDEFASNR